MRLSCSAHCLRDRPLRDALPAIRDAGFDAVEVDWRLVERELASARDKPAALQALLEEHDLTLAGVRIADMAAVDESELRQVVTEIRRQMGLVSQLGLPMVTTGAGDRRQQPLEVLTTGLRMALQAAVEADLSLAVVNARDSAVEQIDSLRQLFLEIDHPRLQLLLDAGQFHESAVNPCDVLREFGDRIGLIRISDRIGRRCVPLGQGEMNVPAIIERTRRSGYDGWLVVDSRIANPREAPQYLADARAYLHTLLSDTR
jgi:sugar phosphate isomerase/epimerase